MFSISAVSPQPLAPTPRVCLFPASLQPCMHTFCAACYSGWMERSSLCPTCRCPVERLRKNHILNNLVEAYLTQHPGQTPRQAPSMTLHTGMGEGEDGYVEVDARDVVWPCGCSQRSAAARRT